MAKYVGRVCDLLTIPQLAPFAIRAPGKPRDDVAGPVCAWEPPDSTAGVGVSVSILSKASNGWEGVYERKSRWAVFEAAKEISGYPAVHIAATKIDFNRGTCVTMIGVNHAVVFETVVFVNVTSSPEYTNPCAVSDKVASLVIDTLKGGR